MIRLLLGCRGSKGSATGLACNLVQCRFAGIRMAAALEDATLALMVICVALCGVAIVVSASALAYRPQLSSNYYLSYLTKTCLSHSDGGKHWMDKQQ